MSHSMYQASVPAFLQMLNNLSAILDKAEAYAGNRKIDPEVLLNYRLAPDMFPFVRQIQIAVAASQGAMWTMFKEIIASNGASSSTPHTPSRTSMATGVRTLGSPSVALHALMLAREAESGSLGSQTSPGSAFAKQMTCSPVPDPISSATPCFGRTRVSTSRIGPQLRAADGENCRASPACRGTLSKSGCGG